MGLTLEQKQAVVAEVAVVAATAPVAIAAEYSGLNVAEMTALRRSARTPASISRWFGTPWRAGLWRERSSIACVLRLRVRCSLPFPMKSLGLRQKSYATSPKKMESWSSGLSPWMAACSIHQTLNALRVCLPRTSAFHVTGLAAGPARQIPACPVRTGGETPSVA